MTDAAQLVQLPPLPLDVVRAMHDAMAGYFQFRCRVVNSPYDIFNNVDVHSDLYQQGLIELYNAVVTAAAAKGPYR